ncbi:MAG TPA: AI-2E family transporter [Thermoanaerobaculia bacterium]|nr:AI-2E family transporter [Thermoanaerobaculia bacterium]
MAFQPRDIVQRAELELFVRKLAIVIAAAILVAILWAARPVLILIFIAGVLAAGISPAVRRVRVWWRFIFDRNLPRSWAVLIVYLPFLALAVSLLVFMVPHLIVDMRALGEQLPALIDKNVLTPMERFIPMTAVRQYLNGGINVPRSRVVLYVRNAATVIAEFVAVLFMVGYMLVDAHRLRNLALLFYPPEVRADRRATMNRMAKRMSSWLGGQLILSGIIGVATFVGLLVLRVPYALPLAISATFGEMVPVIGPIVGTAPALAIAILQSRWQFWSVLLMAILLQKLENFFIAPRVMSRKVEISPLAVFIAFMIGAAVLGIVGALMAIPVAAIAQVAFEEAFVEPRERRHDLARAGTLTKRRRR